MNKAGQRTSRWLSYWLRRRRWSAQHIDFTSNIYTTFSIHLIHHIVITLNDNHCVTVDNVGSSALFSNMISQTHKDMQIITYRWSAKCTVTYTYYQHNFTCQTWCLFYYLTSCHKTISAILKYGELITYTYYLIWKKKKWTNQMSDNTALYTLFLCLSLADLERNIVAVLGWTEGSPSASAHYAHKYESVAYAASV